VQQTTQQQRSQRLDLERNWKHTNVLFLQDALMSSSGAGKTPGQELEQHLCFAHVLDLNPQIASREMMRTRTGTHEKGATYPLVEVLEQGNLPRVHHLVAGFATALREEKTHHLRDAGVELPLLPLQPQLHLVQLCPFATQAPFVHSCLQALSSARSRA
jgi:hypothetical protein